MERCRPHMHNFFQGMFHLEKFLGKYTKEQTEKKVFHTHNKTGISFNLAHLSLLSPHEIECVSFLLWSFASVFKEKMLGKKNVTSRLALVR